MRVWVFALVCLWAWKGACPSPSAPTVGLESPWCRLEGSELICDFDGTRQMVLMTERFNGSVRKVSVNGASQLHLSESLCVPRVSVNRVSEVVVVRGESEPCQQSDVHLTVLNSLLDRLPNRVTHLHLENSKIGSLSSSAAAVKNITVFNSHIDVLDLSRPLGGAGAGAGGGAGASATFRDSTVRKMERLEMAGHSHLRMHRTSVNIVASKGLVLREGARVALVESTVWPLADDSVLLGGGASISLENYPGKFSVKSIMETKPSLRQSDVIPVERVEKGNFFVGFIVCLVIMVLLSVMLLITCIKMRKERANNRTALTINNINRSDNIARYNRSSSSDTKQSNSDAETNLEIRPMLQKSNNVSEKVSNDKQNYLKEMTNIEENIFKIQEQKSNDVTSLKTSRAERIIEIHSKYATLRQIRNQNMNQASSSSDEEGERKGKQNKVKAEEGIEFKDDDVMQMLLATEKAKLSLLESEYESKILEIRISSWRSELEEKLALIQRKESFINCMKENRDNAMLQVFKPYGNNLNELKKVRTAKDYLTRMITTSDESFKDQLQKLKNGDQKVKKSSEEEASDRVRILKNRYEVNKDSISNRKEFEMRPRKPKNEGSSDLLQTLRKMHEITYDFDVKRTSAECDPALELRFQQDVVTMLDKYIKELELCVDFIVLIGNIVQEET
ncbi:uncharacterized protein LOC122265293 [Penaeus japonicus]|uniref:uncharacterized protein LOC122265293 n=1 Tax=Penaeus japonicus TaxID=27405 RepID=UPI001C70FB59|nr:uncharacterized protein LOC122265293 [Penaeus japonicus]